MDISELGKIYKAKRQKTKRINDTVVYVPGFSTITFNDFKKWFDLPTFNKGCHYCGTTNERSYELYQLRPYATRGGKRGKRLELDRKDPREPYDNLNNLVWCCYWCNNAKSNFFTYSEFKDIAVAIGKVLKNIVPQLPTFPNLQS